MSWYISSLFFLLFFFLYAILYKKLFNDTGYYRAQNVFLCLFGMSNYVLWVNSNWGNFGPDFKGLMVFISLASFIGQFVIPVFNRELDEYFFKRWYR